MSISYLLHLSEIIHWEYTSSIMLFSHEVKVVHCLRASNILEIIENLNAKYIISTKILELSFAATFVVFNLTGTLFGAFCCSWNRLDIAIVILSIIGIILEEIKSGFIPINPTIIRAMRVLRIARGRFGLIFQTRFVLLTVSVFFTFLLLLPSCIG